MPFAIPNLTTEKLGKILNDKLRPLNEQLKQALERQVSFAGCRLQVENVILNYKTADT